MARNIKNKIIYPPPYFIIAVDAAAALLLAAVFFFKLEDTAFAYAVYPFSVYAGVITSASIGRYVSVRLKRRFYKSNIIKRIESYPLGYKYIHEMAFRGEVSIYMGAIVNLVFAIFRTSIALMYQTLWLSAIAAYYAVLGIIKIMLALSIHGKKGSLRDEYKTYRACGILMLFLHIGMVGMTVQMVHDNRFYEYNGYVIYISAMYTFYTMISAAVNLFKYRKLKNPVLSASKAVTFIGAMMSVMVLQGAMIAYFEGGDETFRYVSNEMTGAAVCTAAFVIAVYMIVKSFVKLRQCPNA